MLRKITATWKPLSPSSFQTPIKGKHQIVTNVFQQKILDTSHLSSTAPSKNYRYTLSPMSSNKQLQLLMQKVLLADKEKK